MKPKPVEHVFAPPPPHMVGDGFRVHNFFPNGYKIGSKRMSPFFLLDYNSKIDFSPREEPRGVGVHPHRGFETVTIAYKGKVAHHDSSGNRGVIGEGDVQWMTAGSGVLHKEYHEENFSKSGGPFQMIQLWVNLPSKYKMTRPSYQAITLNQMGKYDIPGDGGRVEVIAGNYKGVKGPVTSFSPIEMYNIHLKKGASLAIELPPDFNTGLLIVEGNVTINEKDKAPADHFVLFKNEGEEIALQAEEDSLLLLLSGESINEPLAAYGPFLMNTNEELEQAYADLRAGKFGVLED
jgi:redox-sensitive bicupin YhaK (pirin superfamily)